MKDKLLWLGSLLVLTGLIGFTTVADDLRHLGEFLAVSALLIMGIVLIVISIRSKRVKHDSPNFH